MKLVDQLKTHVAGIDWRVALQIEDALTCVGEGKRLAAALTSARTRHATNISISACRIQPQREKLGNGYRLPYWGYPFAEIVIASEGGTWTGRRYEIHIPFRLEKDGTEANFDSRNYGMDYAFLVTSSRDGRGTYKYPIPILAAWNVFRSAVARAGELRACEEGLVEVFEVGGYEEPLPRDQKTFEEYLKIGWKALQPELEADLNTDFTRRRELVLEWDNYDEAPGVAVDSEADPVAASTPLPDIALLPEEFSEPLAEWERALLEG